MPEDHGPGIGAFDRAKPPRPMGLKPRLQSGLPFGRIMAHYAITQTASATGTAGDATIAAGIALQEPARTLVPRLVLNPGKPCTPGAIADKSAGVGVVATAAVDTSKTLAFTGENAPLTTADTSGGKAGDGTRTRNSQLGRLALYH